MRNRPTCRHGVTSPCGICGPFGQTLTRRMLAIPGRIADWATDPSTPAWKGALAVGGMMLAALAPIAGIILLIVALTGGASCPAGQHEVSGVGVTTGAAPVIGTNGTVSVGISTGVTTVFVCVPNS